MNETTRVDRPLRPLIPEIISPREILARLRAALIRRGYLVLFVLVGAVGCASPIVPLGETTPAGLTKTFERTITYSISAEQDSNGMSAADFADEFIAAAAKWAPVGGYVTLDDAAPRVLRCYDTDWGDAAATTNSAGTILDCLYLSGLPVAAREHVFTHEVGHAFGLNHVSDTSAVMTPDVGPSSTDEIDHADIVEFNRANGVVQ